MILLPYQEPPVIDISENEMKNELDKLSENLSANDIKLTDLMLSRLEKFTRLLMSWNSVVNLTAIQELPQIMTKHYFDSIAPLAFLDFPENARVIDVGTGAGFPAIPLKIYRDDLSFTLLDSSNKRLNFINTASTELKLSDMKTCHLRAEDAGASKEHRQKYDICVSRALANLSVLCEYCLPFVKPGGYFYAYKGQNAQSELENAKNAVKVLGGQYIKSVKLKLPDEEGIREVLIIKKISQTPTLYPRKSIKITNNPL